MANTARRSTTGPASGTTRHRRPPPSEPVPGRRAAASVQHAEHIALRIPGIGQVRLPRPEHLAFYAALGALVALEILEWPAAVVLAAGHALTSQGHNRAITEFGEALEEA